MLAIEIKILLFALVGSLGLLTDFCLTWLLRDKLSINQYLANAIGFSVAAIQNFVLNRTWTFGDRSQAEGYRQLLLFLLISLIGLIINTKILKWFIGQNEKYFYLYKLIAVVIVFIWNFVMNNLLTFSK